MEKKINENVISESYLNVEIVSDVVIVRKQISPQMPPVVIFCGSKKEFADKFSTM